MKKTRLAEGTRRSLPKTSRTGFQEISWQLRPQGGQADWQSNDLVSLMFVAPGLSQVIWNARSGHTLMGAVGNDTVFGHSWAWV